MLEYWANPYNFKFFDRIDRIKWIDVLEFNPPNPVHPVEKLLLCLFLFLDEGLTHTPLSERSSSRHTGLESGGKAGVHRADKRWRTFQQRA
jgi:hypothetical protein